MNSKILSELDNKTLKRKSKIIDNYLRDLLVNFLELETSNTILSDQSFIDMGIDSVQAIDFKIIIENDFDCSLRTTSLFDYPTLELLVQYLVDVVNNSDTEEA